MTHPLPWFNRRFGAAANYPGTNRPQREARERYPQRAARERSPQREARERFSASSSGVNWKPEIRA